jgi:hypothetical protein
MDFTHIKDEKEKDLHKGDHLLFTDCTPLYRSNIIIALWSDWNRILQNPEISIETLFLMIFDLYNGVQSPLYRSNIIKNNVSILISGFCKIRFQSLQSARYRRTKPFRSISYSLEVAYWIFAKSSFFAKS